MTPLHKEMIKQGMSMKTLAKRTGIGIFYLYNLRNGGRTNPSWRVACLIAHALKTDPSDLFSRLK